ncbi:hypothetical protein TRFO_39280 [Tritrichomonas foetus]|uniref:Uncharacterized protein n=1 Tax=Tritrichomonas foetus TaxID=1144522 RepID=A0A1J4JBC6_9EUKA|nr:hypothetical protein TRFO_39280 [Tritrichomonas foetus]|eukprot:OHS94548.1 hypothetical protein TRFO_39280 [Tritrichomonas foetus]
MYFEVDTNIFRDVPGVPALLSAAEMLQQKLPEISGVFARYAAGLVQNHLAQNGSSPDRDAAFSALNSKVGRCQCADARELERFADALVASSDGPYSSDFIKLAYLSYTAMSLFGALPSRIITKMSKTEQGLDSSSQMGAPISIPGQSPAPYSGGPPQFTPGGPPQFSPGGPPQYSPSVGQSGGGAGAPPQFTPGAQVGFGANPQTNGPPQFNPSGQGPPQFAPNAGGPPQFTPGAPPSGGPPAFTPYGQGPPQFTPYGQGPPAYPSVGPPSYGGNSSTVSDSAVKLTELAQNAFQAGATDVALSAIVAAIKELEK